MEQLYRLERIRRLLLRVEAARTLCGGASQRRFHISWRHRIKYLFGHFHFLTGGMSFFVAGLSIFSLTMPSISGGVGRGCMVIHRVPARNRAHCALQGGAAKRHIVSLRNPQAFPYPNGSSPN